MQRSKHPISAFEVYNNGIAENNADENIAEMIKVKSRKQKGKNENPISVEEKDLTGKSSQQNRKQKNKGDLATAEEPLKKKRGRKAAENVNLNLSSPKSSKSLEHAEEMETTAEPIAIVEIPVDEEKSAKSADVTKRRKKQTVKNEPMRPAAVPISEERTQKLTDETKGKQKKDKTVFEHKVEKEFFCSMAGTTPSHKTFKFFADDLSFGDSSVAAEKAFSWMVFPVKKTTFTDQIFEHKPFYVSRAESHPAYYQGLFSTEDLLKIIDQNDLEYGVNLDVTQYVDGIRSTENLEGRVHSKVIQDFFDNGCSVRLLNPQTYSESVWLLTSTLQEFFGTFVGANVYLTPPGTQGFAPHYDDIEAFVLQLEGKKRWSVYEPKCVLPRFSSRNFTPDEVGKLVLSVELNPGDMLYMPRGFVHQASCLATHHSLHITVSSNQLNTYADLFEKMLPQVLKIAAEKDVEFRRSLPMNYMRFTGVAFEDSKKNNAQRVHFDTQVKTLFKRLANFLPIDGACDQMSKKFIIESQPPTLIKDEKIRSVLGADVKFDQKKSAIVSNSKDFDLKTEIRLIREFCLRLLVEGESEPVVYHNVNNSRVFQGKEPQKLTVSAEEAVAVEFLIKAYPSFSSISSLPLESDEDKIAFCLALYEKCLLMTKDPSSPTKR